MYQGFWCFGGPMKALQTSEMADCSGRFRGLSDYSTGNPGLEWFRPTAAALRHFSQIWQSAIRIKVLYTHDTISASTIHLARDVVSPLQTAGGLKAWH